MIRCFCVYRTNIQLREKPTCVYRTEEYLYWEENWNDGPDRFAKDRKNEIIAPVISHIEGLYNETLVREVKEKLVREVIKLHRPQLMKKARLSQKNKSEEGSTVCVLDITYPLPRRLPKTSLKSQRIQTKIALGLLSK